MNDSSSVGTFIGIPVQLRWTDVERGEVGVLFPDLPDERRRIGPGARGVEDQQLDVGQLGAQLERGPGVVGLEHDESAHAEQARDREQERVVVADHDAAPLVIEGVHGRWHCGVLGPAGLPALAGRIGLLSQATLSYRGLIGHSSHSSHQDIPCSGHQSPREAYGAVH